jgi:uncharacterized protein YdaU (DUF1376 family)
MHYYQFNIGDYAKKTRHLNNLEDLAYRRLLDVAYDTEKPIPSDIKKLSRLIAMPNNQEEIQNVLGDFFELSESGYIQNRISEEVEKYHAKADSARANGKKGGRPKKLNPELTQAKPKITHPVNLANPDITGSEANHKPITNNHKPIKVPYQRIVDEYHNLLPEMPRINILSDKRKRLIKKIFDFKDEHKTIDWWINYFNFVRGSNHLMGRNERQGDYQNWKCDFEFLTKFDNFVKIIDRKYH